MPTVGTHDLFFSYESFQLVVITLKTDKAVCLSV